MTHTLFANYLPLSVLHRFTQKSPLSQSVPFGTAETLKITLTAQEKGKSKRPHQAFLILRETTTGVEAPFPLTVKENGKATLEIVRPTLTYPQCPKRQSFAKTLQGPVPGVESQLLTLCSQIARNKRTCQSST